MSARHVLLWSGGFDSTAILLSMVDDPKNYPHVRVVSCGLKNANNYEEDKAARATIRTSLVESGNSMSHIEFARELELEIDVYGGTQASVWAWLAAMNVGRQDDDTTIVCGYMRGDDFWHTKNEWQWTVDYMVKLVNPKGVNFLFPLEWTTKKENVAAYLKHPGVFRALSWGGDTKTMKLKEKEDLEFLFNELQKVKDADGDKILGGLKEEFVLDPTGVKEACTKELEATRSGAGI